MNPENMEPKSRLSDLNLKCWVVLSREQFNAKMSECSGIEWFKTEAKTIENRLRPHFEFSADGHTFGLFLDGELLLNFLKSQSVMICKDENNPGIQEVKNLAGMILEIGVGDQPMVFKDSLEMGKAWRELHRASNVHLTDDDEMSHLEICDWEESDGQPL